MPGILMVLSGPSGVGKGALAARLKACDDKLRISVSATTREMRPGEEDGVSYHYLTKEQFDRMREENAFLECASVHCACYGTPRAAVEKLLDDDYDVVLEIDVQGAKQVRASFPQAIHVFVLPPSFEELEARLRGRKTETEAQIALRLRNARDELALMPQYDYAVVNDDLEEAVCTIRCILKAEKARVGRITPGAGMF